MIIVGDRARYSKTLAAYLLSRATNEAVFIRDIDNYPVRQLSPKNLAHALQLMETQALAKGLERPLYHAVLSLPTAETLNQEQLKIAIDTLTRNLKLIGHQRVVVEHRKSGRQHFHIVYNLLNPITGRVAALKFPYFAAYRTQIELEQQFGLTREVRKGRSIRHWEYLRGKRSGIDPCQLRKEVTAIFNARHTTAEFIKALAKAGCVLSFGQYSYVIVDKAGDVHSLVRRIEGARLADIEKKFPDLKNMKLPLLDAVRKKLRKAFPRKKISRDCRAAGRLLKRENRRARAPALYRSTPPKPFLKNGVAPLLVAPKRPGRRNEEAMHMYAPLPRGKSKLYVNEAAKANFPDPEFERAELIAWAFRNGRFDILAQFGIFCAPEAPEAQSQ